MMYKPASQVKPEIHFLSFHSRFSPTLAQRLNVLILLLSVALLTTSCGTAAQAAGSSGNTAPHTLNVSGSLPAGTVSQSYNAVLAVSGGNSPYHFSVKTGSLPAGLTLNPRTGSFSGQPTTPGDYSFEVIVTDSPRLDEGSQMFSIAVGGNNGGGGNVKVSVSPSSATVTSGLKQQFTATVSGTSHTAVTWSATAGSINANGVYTAPTVTSSTNVTVTATSQVDSSKSANAAVTVNPVNQQGLTITTGGLPQAVLGSSYSEVLTAAGGTTPYSWNISSGTPPSGIALNANGDFSGLPNTAGTFNFTVKVTDATAKTATASFSVTVVAGGNYDGPAELPRVTVPSAMSDTPAPGSVIAVSAGGDLQAAMNSAHCGDTIQLQAGATFSGKFTVPAKNCDINHWIIIRTSSPDSALPPEGTRATPCFAGVGSLEGRPAYTCNNPKNVMAKVQMEIHDDGPFQFANGANFYRFVGLEVTRPNGTPGPAVLFSAQGTADHLVFDRLWLHGQAQDETHNGVSLAGTTNVAVVDSYLNDFKCIAGTGKCTDAHAISGGTGDTQDGPYKIQNNFLEASTEAVMFGGGEATMTPTDITITNNHFFKPWQWMEGNKPYVGGPDGHPFVVKNHLEMKNAVRVLVEANLMEDTWGGFTQGGYGILLTPKNQHTPSGSNVCPICQVTDVTIRYTHVSHGGGGIQMATSLSGSGTGGAPALAGTRWSVHDVVLDDLNKKYNGGGTAFEIMNDWPSNPLNTITVNHVTAFPDSEGHLILTGNVHQGAPMYALVFTNNLVITGKGPVWNTGGGSDNCAYKDVPITTIDNCFTSYTFGNNGLIASPSKYPPSSWPTNNMFPAAVSNVEFVNFNNGNGGNYELQSSSPYKGKGADGKDLGADIAGLNQALANVE
jgi:Putative Ig domain